MVVLPDVAPVIVGQAVGRGARVHPVRKVVEEDVDAPGRVGSHVDVSADVLGYVDVPPAHGGPKHSPSKQAFEERHDYTPQRLLLVIV